MATAKPTSEIRLDWTKLLGFDQATRVEGEPGGARLTAPTLTKLGGKLGAKAGAKPGLRIRR